MYTVRIDRFEGPFDLLVYLVESAKMDIYDIRVGEITEQYLDYIKKMDELDMEVSTEFIVLAAVLIRLKSQMLLPRVNDEGEIVIDEDPRLELATRLSEYMRTKRIAEMLEEREKRFMNVREKPAEDLSQYLDDPDELLRADTDQLVAAFHLFLDKKKRVSDVKTRYQRVRRQRASIEDRIKYMYNRLDEKLSASDGADSVPFTEIIPDGADKYDVTLSFLSLLELLRTQVVDAEQKDVYGEILVSKQKRGEIDVQ